MTKTFLAVSMIGIALAAGSATAQTITEADIVEAQKAWGEAIVAIGRAYTSKGDYKALAAQEVDTLYGYDEGIVLFKPTKAAADQFRLTKVAATSYFVGGVIKEDHGFALQPWSKVRFENAGTITDSDSAIAMGNYFFTDAKTNEETKVEFTFAYFRGPDGKLLINVHDSAFPYKPPR